MSNPPSNIVDGARKRWPTARVTDNGDPLIKKPRTTAITSVTTTATSLSRRASIEDIVEPTPIPGPQPHRQSRILEAADGSDDDEDKDIIGMPHLEPIVN